MHCWRFFPLCLRGVGGLWAIHQVQGMSIPWLLPFSHQTPIRGQRKKCMHCPSPLFLYHWTWGGIFKLWASPLGSIQLAVHTVLVNLTMWLPVWWSCQISWFREGQKGLIRFQGVFQSILCQLFIIQLLPGFSSLIGVSPTWFIRNICWLQLMIFPQELSSSRVVIPADGAITSPATCIRPQVSCLIPLLYLPCTPVSIHYYVFWFCIPYSSQICSLSLNLHCYAHLVSGQLK